MKINNIGNKYINFNNSNAKPIKHEDPVKSKKYDVIELSNKTNDISDINNKKSDEIDKIKNDIILQINKQTSSEKIDKIKESIKNNTYKIDVDEILNKLLDK